MELVGEKLENLNLLENVKYGLEHVSFCLMKEKKKNVDSNIQNPVTINEIIHSFKDIEHCYEIENLEEDGVQICFNAQNRNVSLHCNIDPEEFVEENSLVEAPIMFDGRNESFHDSLKSSDSKIIRRLNYVENSARKLNINKNKTTCTLIPSLQLTMTQNCQCKNKIPKKVLKLRTPLQILLPQRPWLLLRRLPLGEGIQKCS